jgi:hypothetical protein
MNGRQRNVTNAKLWGKLHDSNYDGNCKSRHFWGGGVEISAAFVVVVAQSAQYLLGNTNN